MRLLMFLVLFVLFVAVAKGGDIQGKVVNAQGGPVAGAKVMVSNQEGGARWEASTDEEGFYTVSGLGPGIYTVTVTAPTGGALRREVAVGSGTISAQADFQFPQAAAQAVAAAEERNPNIFVYRIDLNDLRNRLTIARGPDPQYVPEFRPEQNYLGSEFGAPLLSFELVGSRSLLSQWRATLSGMHQNSALNARNFFNVGPLRASRLSNYGINGSGPLVRDKASLLLQFGQGFTSGFVNGNILAPLAKELTPLSSDPQINGIIRNLLNAYPAELPNLRGRRLNSNAPRDIDMTDAVARLDVRPTEDASVAFRYLINDYSEVPFQLVAGQNPQTDVRSQGAHASLTSTLSPESVGRWGVHFDRVAASLRPTRRFEELLAPLGISPVPDVDFAGDQFTDLGPGKQFPRLRVQNRFMLYTDVSRRLGKHNFKVGWGSTRVQVNDLQSDNSRGTLQFSPDFGRQEVENFLLGTPSSFIIALGNFYRGFRNWEHSFFVEDQIRLLPSFTLSLGVRYELMTAPTEVNGLTDIGFPTDKNNFAPRVGLAWNPGGGDLLVRAGYGISYSTIFPVTYGMTRFNPPATQVLAIPAPSLINPLAGFSAQPTQGGRSSLFQLSPDLVFPYSHLYTLSLERPIPWSTTVRLAYIGMRSFHLLTLQFNNRAQPVPGIPITTATINQRRPDARYFDINVVESNSISYYDAVQLSVDKRLSHGLTFRTAYTFGKNIDLGGDFTNTASGVESPPEMGNPSCEICDHFSDQKSWSLFDTPHVLTFTYSYNLPFPVGANGWAAALFSGWQISGTTIFQSGTPFHAHTGGDGPGLGNVDGAGSDRPNILNPAILGKSLDDPDTSMTIWKREYFDTNLPPSGRGNIGFNNFRKDGTQNWNFALGRTFRLPGGRERTLQFRSEFINLFNHAQFVKPGVNYASSTFGEITNTVNKGRQVQFSLRLNF